VARVSEGLLNHARNIAKPYACPDEICLDLEESVVVRFGDKLRKRTWIHAPSSKNAVVGGPGSKGGYDGWLQGVVADGFNSQSPEGVPPTPFDWLNSYPWLFEDRVREANSRIAPFPGKDSLVNRLLAIAQEQLPTTGQVGELMQGYGTLLSMDEFSRLGGAGWDSRFVHEAAPIAEQGCKVRVITIPPPSVFTAGDICRKAVFPVLRKLDKRIRDFGSRVDSMGHIDGMNGSARGDWRWISADLTKATDGFSHDAIRAVVRGLGRAGLPSLYTETILQSLGVGRTKHYVRYHRKSFTKTQWEEVAALGAVDSDGKCVDVPMNRGCLMGTPFSFTILSIINGWAAEVFGRNTVICGDDLATLALPHQVRIYSECIAAVGSGLHKGKTFVSDRGYTFCETFCLAEGPGGCPRFYNPYPLKQFMRDGSGVMDKGAYFAPQWKALRRVARVLCKDVRAKARRLRRPPELPVALGGLGHPSKGMRDVPKVVRAQLYTLLRNEEINPSKYATRVDIFFSPADARLFRETRDSLESSFDGPALQPWEIAPEGACRVSNRMLRAHVARQAHLDYWTYGGKYRACRPKAMKPGTLKLPSPGPGQFSKLTPWASVATMWSEKLDREGRAVPIDIALDIRGFKPPSADTTVRGVGGMPPS
jgi:hypothetical protein